MQRMQRQAGKNSRGPIVSHDPQPLGQPFELSRRRRLGNIEQPVQAQSRQSKSPDVQGAEFGTKQNTNGMLKISSSTIAPGSFAPAPKRRTAAVQIGMPIQQSNAITMH